MDEARYWLQPPMYTEMKRQREETRVNASFEDQVAEMNGGQWDADDGDSITMTKR
jgi:hypothetical protein